jgi:hypothetical protein
VNPLVRIASTGLALVVLVGLGVPVAGVVPAAAARAAASDLTLVADALYTVRPDDRRVGIAASITVTNRTRETKTRRYFFDHAFLAVQPGTTGFKLSGAPGASVRVVRRTGDSTLLRLGFGKRLYSGARRTYRLTFDLLGGGKGANPQTRVGTGLVTVPLWAYASNGASGSTVSIAFPEGWDVTVARGSMPITATGPEGGTVLRSGRIAAPLTWFAYVIGQEPAVYKDHSVTVRTEDGIVPLLLRAWVDDPAWASRTGRLFRSAVPALREQLGIPWPHDEPMVVQEAVSRADGAYAGLFDPAENSIEVAYWADGLVTLHEAAHAWFNGSLLADRWANEGFASLYARRTADMLEVQGASPAMTDTATAAAIPLNAWPKADPAGITDAGTRARETYGFAASYQLAQAIAERAGDDVLRRVWSAAAARTGAYQPPPLGDTAADTPSVEPIPEGVDGPPDWRGLLDLLEGEAGTSFSDLWAEWVVRPEEASLLDARAEARRSYERTMAVAGDWQLPRAIRDALRAWQFEDAEQQMADARTVLAQHEALLDLAGTTGVDLPDRMRVPFEDGRMAEASTQAELLRNTILAIRRAEAARGVDDDILSRIGMLGEDPEADLAAAREAFGRGDIEATLASADDAYRAWAGAWQEGRRRAMLALAGIATLLVLVSAASGAVRRTRRRAVQAAPHDPAGPR